MASPEVISDIKTRIRKNRVLTIADALLARDAGLLPITGVERLSMNDGIIYEPADLAQRGERPARAPSPSTQLSLTRARGTLRCLVILVDFDDNPAATPPHHFETLLFDPANPNSMRSFYRDMSYGKLDIEGVVTPWLRAPHPYSYYTNGTSGTGHTFPNNTPGLLHDMLDIYTATGSFQGFDLNGDGYVDGLFLVHAGMGAEADSDAQTRGGKIWSHKWVLPQAYMNSGLKAYAYFTAPEDGKLGVFAHEFGHFLGLPDLYDTSYRSRGVGNWCLMGGGSWGGGGDSPTRLSAWCLSELGWIKPGKINGLKNVTLATLESGAEHCFQLDPANGPKHEYFLIENRQKTGRDSALPGSGLAVWHIDKSQTSNANPLSYMVALVQADGRRDLEFNTNSGDTSDLFPGRQQVTKVDSSSLVQPNTILNSGNPSGISITRIATGPKRTISATLKA